MNDTISTEDWIKQESAQIKARIERKAKRATAAVLKQISADAAAWHAGRKASRQAVDLAGLLKIAFAAGCQASRQGQSWALHHDQDAKAYAGFLQVHDYLRRENPEGDGAYGMISNDAFDLLSRQGFSVPVRQP